MSLFLLELVGDFTTRENVNAMVVNAADAADARAIAKAEHTGAASDAAWDAATVTDLTTTEVTVDTANSMPNWRFKVAILDSVPVIDITSVSALGAVSAVVAVGGATYDVNDVETVVGGTFTRAATFRVTAETGNVVDTVELVDPGEYTVMPGNPVATTGNGDGNLTLTLTNDDDRMANHLANLVTQLTATSIITLAAIDMGAATPLVTVAEIADGIGDKKLQVQAIPPEITDTEGFPTNSPTPIPGLIGTIVDEGVSGAVLTFEVPAATYVVPSVRSKFTKR